MPDYDAIIIGAGLGGLTAGAKLAREGRKVLLLEQHFIPGGCATTFKRGDFIMEVGLHEMDGLDAADPKTRIFEELDIFRHVQTVPIKDFYRVIQPGLDIVVPHDAERAMDVLGAAYPRERKGIERFFRTIHAIRAEVARLPEQRWKTLLLLPVFPFLFPNLVRHTFTTLGAFLDAIIADEQLKLVLTANMLYYHDDPHSLSLLYFSAGQASYFSGGGHYIQGGSQKLSDYLAATIREHGGEVLLRHRALRILIRGGAAAGVEFTKTRDRGEPPRQAFAPAIIANAAVPSVAGMLSGPARKALERKIAALKPSCSLLTMYLGFNRDLKEVGSTDYCTFLLDRGTRGISDLPANYRDDFARRGIVFVDYGRIDSGLAPKGKSVGVICAADYLEDWDSLSPGDYKRKKEEVAQTLIRRLDQFLPGSAACIEHYEVGTAKTVRRFTLNPEGAVYGYAQVPRQAGIFRLPAASPVPNLYFASAWANPGGGFTGAMLSGWFCAREVLRRHRSPQR